MATGISFSGLGSGVDTASIVDQLIALERQPIATVQTRQDREKTRQSALQDIAARVANLRTAAQALTDPTFWNGTPFATSGDEDSYSVTASAGSPKAAYQVKVLNLAGSDIHVQTSSSGIRQFGATYAGNGVFASGSSLLSSLTTSSGTPMGLAVGQTVTLSGTKGGSPLTGTLAITATTTLDNLRAFVESSVPGARVKVESGGRITITSPPGTDNEATALSLSTGGAAPLFDTAFSSSTQTQAGAGIGTIQADDALHITAGTLTFDVAVTAGMTMAQVATAINAANGGVSAAVTDGKLRLAGTSTGAAQQVSIGSTGATAAQLGLVNAVQASDAQVEVDGVLYTSASNETSDILPGATLTLKRASGVVSTATTDPLYVDKDEASTRVKALVDQYNSTLDLINTKVKEKKVVDATTAADKLKGSLFASSTLISMKASLQSAMAGVIGGLANGKNLGVDVGISTGKPGSGATADVLAGKLTFDSTKFEALFTSDRDAARAIFSADGATSVTDGIAQRVADLTQGFTKGGGLLQAAIDGSGSEVTRLQEQIDRMNVRVTAKEALLKAQFAAMEKAIASQQSAQAALAGFASSSAN